MVLLTAASLTNAQHCDVAVVGSGWAGVYYAYRHFLEGFEPDRICIFEASDRFGGRTFSKHFNVTAVTRTGPPDRFVIDIGAHRFSPDMHLPGDIILKKLKLPTACYEPSCTPANKDFMPKFMFNYSAPLVRITDPATGLPLGFETAIDQILFVMRKAGSHIMLNTQVVDVIPAGTLGLVRIDFANKQSVQAQRVLLNLPRSALLSLHSIRSLAGPRTTKALECAKFDRPKNLFPASVGSGTSLSKAYAYYDNAWWRNTLRKIEGRWPPNATDPTNTSVGIPLGLHWNDGPVVCDAPFKGCRGFLQVFYFFAPQNQAFFEDLRRDVEHPLAVVEAGTPGANAKLSLLHKAIMEVVKPLFPEGTTLPIEAPRMLVVGAWDFTGTAKEHPAPSKVYYSSEMNDSLEKACDAPGLTEAEYRDRVLTPMQEKLPKVHLANNDFVALDISKFFGDWAEESLLQSERALRVLGLPKPDWLDGDYYAKKVVAYTPNSTESINGVPPAALFV